AMVLASFCRHSENEICDLPRRMLLVRQQSPSVRRSRSFQERSAPTQRRSGRAARLSARPESLVLSCSFSTPAGTVLRPDLFDRDPDRDAPFGNGLLTDLFPTRRLAQGLTMPFEHRVHRMRQRDDLGPAVDLNIIGAVEFFSVHQQRDLRIAPDVLYLVRAFARGNRDSAIRADYR